MSDMRQWTLKEKDLGTFKGMKELLEQGIRTFHLLGEIDSGMPGLICSTQKSVYLTTSTQELQDVLSKNDHEIELC